MSNLFLLCSLYRPLLQSISLIPEKKLVAAAQNEMRGHEPPLVALSSRSQLVHEPDLLAYRLPIVFRGIRLDPLAVDLRIFRTVLVELFSDLAVDPVTRKERCDDLAQASATRHGLQMSRIRLCGGSFRSRIELSLG